MERINNTHSGVHIYIWVKMKSFLPIVIIALAFTVNAPEEEERDEKRWMFFTFFCLLSFK